MTILKLVDAGVTRVVMPSEKSAGSAQAACSGVIENAQIPKPTSMTIEEQVWFSAIAAVAKDGTGELGRHCEYADRVLAEFNKRFKDQP